MIDYQDRSSASASTDCGVPAPAFLTDRVEQQIIDFLAGKSHGEELLHALHDHVLDEPIPERMLALLRHGRTAAREPD